MADGNVKVEIVSPERLVLSEDVQSVTVPGQEGNFTVLGEHAPVMSVLRPGFVMVEGGSENLIYVRGGFAEVSDGTVTILAEDARPAKQFNRQEIEEALAKAQQEVSAANGADETEAAQLVVDSLSNLMTEVEHMGSAVVTGL